MKTSTRILGTIKAAAVLLGALGMGGISTVVAGLSPGDGIALAIVYDTSGSMQQPALDAQGQSTPKHVIASRALGAVIDRLQAVASTEETSTLPIQAGLVVFRGANTSFAVKFGPFNPTPYRAWLKAQDKPLAGTPLGEAVRVAGQAVLDSRMPRKHVLVITDGMNTKGPDPTRTIPALQQTARARDAGISFHFVAFDVNAKVFDGVKKLGATVLGAADEKQLNSRLEFILAKKILLEDEEEPSAKPTTD